MTNIATQTGPAVTQGTLDILRRDQASRAAEANWVIEDIVGMAGRRPDRITLKIMQLAMHEAGLTQLVQLEECNRLYSVLRHMLAELDAGHYPTLVSKYWNDGLAQDGWQPPPGTEVQVDPQLQAMRAQIKQWLDSGFLDKKEIEHLPVDTVECYNHLYHLVAQRQAAHPQAPQHQAPRVLVGDTGMTQEEIDAARAQGEAILQKRRSMAWALCVPLQHPRELVEEARYWVSQGDVGLMQDFNAYRAHQGQPPLGTIAEILAETDIYPPLEGQVSTAAPGVNATETKEKTAGTDPAKITDAALRRIKKAMEPLFARSPQPGFDEFMGSPEWAAAVTLMRDSSDNLLTRIAARAGSVGLLLPAKGAAPAPQVQAADNNQPVQQPMPQPPGVMQVPAEHMQQFVQTGQAPAYIQPQEAPCQNAGAAATTPSSAFSPPFNGMTSPAVAQPAPVAPPPMASQAPPVGQPFNPQGYATQPPVNSYPNGMTTPSTTTPSLPDVGAAAPATASTSTGSPPPFANVPPNGPVAGPTYSQPMSQPPSQQTSPPTSPLQELLVERSQLLVRLRILDEGIAHFEIDVDQQMAQLQKQMAELQQKKSGMHALYTTPIDVNAYQGNPAQQYP